jgi:hypothetical protein
MVVPALFLSPQFPRTGYAASLVSACFMQRDDFRPTGISETRLPGSQKLGTLPTVENYFVVETIL